MHGRPTRRESARRADRFVELVAEGRGLLDAAREAGVKAERALRLVDEKTFWPRVVAARRRLQAERAA